MEARFRRINIFRTSCPEPHSWIQNFHHHTSHSQVVSSAIVDKYIGESARLVREMFGYAREHEPCIIFMDEIDAIGGRRFSEGTSADREIQRTLMEVSLDFLLTKKPKPTVASKGHRPEPRIVQITPFTPNPPLPSPASQPDGRL